MKTIKNGMLTLMAAFLVLPLTISGQTKEVPVTTSSKEALKFFDEGLTKFDNMEMVAATPLFDKAISADPKFGLAYLYRSQSGGGHAELLKNLEKAVSLMPDLSAGEQQEIGYFKAQTEGDGMKQKQSVDWLLNNFPDDKRVQALAGDYYYFTNDFKTALTHFSKAASLDKDYAAVYNMIGYCQSALNNFPEAEEAFQTYIKLSPDSGNPYDSFGELLLKMGKYDESIAQYKMAVQKDPLNFSSSLAGIANNYVFKGDFESARKYYQEYFDKAPDVTGKLNAIYLKGVSYVYEGNVDKALQTFEDYRALANKENRVLNVINSYITCGFMLTESGKPEEAKKYFDKADELTEKSNLTKSDKDYLKLRSEMSHIYLLSELKQLDKANSDLENCRKMVESRMNPDEEMTLNSLSGFYNIKKGDYSDALNYLLKGDQESPVTWYYTALAYKNKGDLQEAHTILEKIDKCNVNSLDLALVKNRAKEEMAMK